MSNSLIRKCLFLAKSEPVHMFNTTLASVSVVPCNCHQQGGPLAYGHVRSLNSNPPCAGMHSIVYTITQGFIEYLLFIVVSLLVIKL